MMKSPTNIIREHGQTSALVALGFYTIGLACLVASLGILLGFPEVLRGDPYRIEVLALAALAIPGFVGSFVFGTFYAVASLLSSTGLWSRRLALVHLGIHAFGMGWLVVAFGGMPFLDRPLLALVAGGLIVLTGVLLLIFNMLTTASRLNRWEPAQISVILALFWLSVTAVLGIALVIDRFFPVLQMDALRLVEAHALLALAGFLWLGLLGTCLKLFSMFVVGRNAPGMLSWSGLIIINSALLAMVPILLFYPGTILTAVLTVSIFAGSLCYFADMIRIFLGSRKRPDAGTVCGLLGIASGLAVLAWVFAGMPVWTPPETVLTAHELARIQISLAVLGTFTLVFLGMGTRIAPFLVWRIRYAPLIGKVQTPSGEELINARGQLPTLICLSAGFLYLGAGQLSNNPAGTQLAIICLFGGVGWFLYSISPALRAFFFGINPVPVIEKREVSASILDARQCAETPLQR